jgi:hypothetical protein
MEIFIIIEDPFIYIAQDYRYIAQVNAFYFSVANSPTQHKHYWAVSDIRVIMRTHDVDAGA